ncbi:MAG: hypothetical protein CL759_06925 [Chloroflexi bacterium]|nr:hypothetical protein [Chloroflexota bacterium]|tara:strand:+ start:273 stop:941 length:669 start_codon:yes stop_codon:yes gene_type:complete
METSAPASAFVDDTGLDRAINRSLRQLYNKLVLKRGADFYAAEKTIASEAGRASYPLPADFFQCIEVIASDGNFYRSLPQWGYKDLAELKRLETLTSGQMWQWAYRIVADAIEIRPQPQSASNEIILRYVPTLPEMTNPNDKFDGFNGFEDWACYTAAIDLLNKEESFEQAAALTAVFARLDRQLNDLAGTRDAGRPQKVQDTRKTGWWRRGRYRRRNSWYW